MQNNNKIFVYILIIFFAVFVGSGVFLVMNNKKINNKEQAATTAIVKQKDTVIPTSMSTKGFINLKNNSVDNKVSNPLNLKLTIDSNGENVTAFDTVISYDQVSFDFIKADSIDPNFKVYSYKKDNHLTLTVVKTGLSTDKSIFKNEEIIKLVFQPKAKGSFTFTILSSFEKETTKLVNEKTEVIYPGTNEVKITIN